MTSRPRRYTLVEGGRIYEIETESAGWQTVARLYVDGVQRDEQRTSGGAVHLTAGGLTVVVRLTWLGQVREVLAVPQGVDPKRADVEGIAFAPPPGSRAARLERLKRRFPELYAARHVAWAVLQVLVGVLGIGALLSGLLPAIPWPALPAIPWPDLPDIPWPRIPWPDVALPDLAILRRIKETWSAVSWLAPIAIAVLVAVNEVRKRRTRAAVEATRQRLADNEAVSRHNGRRAVGVQER
jgi:hypothetical protein